MSELKTKDLTKKELIKLIKDKNTETFIRFSDDMTLKISKTEIINSLIFNYDFEDTFKNIQYVIYTHMYEDKVCIVFK